jgi:DNA polymerase I-like protein with 3'-5' exonuclease and polymerase domains
MGTPREMAMHLKIETKIMEEFQDVYFGQFPGIRTYHTNTAREVQTRGFLVNPFGRRRHFLGRLWDNSTIKEAVAFLPQSFVADYLNTGLFAVWRANLPLELLLQIHDAILFQFSDERVIAQAKDLISFPKHIDGYGELVIPCEATVGLNWEKVHYNEDGSIAGNPNGLKKYLVRT